MNLFPEGIDIDPSVLEIAKRDYPADNVEYLQDDMSDASPYLPKWRESFDKVVNIGRTMLFPKLPEVMANMTGCLKPGGQLLCIIPNDDMNFFGGAAKVIEDHPEWGHRVKVRWYIVFVFTVLALIFIPLRFNTRFILFNVTGGSDGVGSEPVPL